MEALIAQVIDWVKDNPTWALAAVFLISLSESLAVVGLVVPGVMMMGAMGALIAAGAIGFWPVIWAAVAGAIIGDGLSFWLGRYFRNDIRRLWPFNRYPETLDFGVRFFDKYGSLSIVFGRFVGPVRPVIPVVAGMMGMAQARFTVANVVSALLWAPAYLLPGILVGASVKFAAESAMRLAIVLLGLFGAIWLIGSLVGTAFRLLSPHASAWVQALLRWGEVHPKAGELARALADPNHPDARTLTALAGVLTLGVALFALATGLNVLSHGELRIDLAALELGQSLSSPLADRLMLFLSRPADLAVILVLILVVYAYERLRRGGRQANYWLAAGGFALVAPSLLQAVLQMSAPNLGQGVTPTAAPEEGLYAALAALTPWAAHHGHVLRATVMFGFLAVALARTLPPAWRGLPYIMSAVLVTAVSLARIYLGAEWPSGVLASIALGLVWVGALGLAFRRHTADDPRLIGLWPLTIITLGLAVSLQTWLRQDADLARYRPAPTPIDASIEDWRNGLWQQLPLMREDIWQRENQPLDIQYLGAPQALADALVTRGWVAAPPLDWVTALNLFSPTLPLRDLPVPPQVHAGRHETLALVKPLPDGRRLVLRLWATRYRLDGTPLWIGNVSTQRKDLVLSLLAIPATDQDFTDPKAQLAQDLNGLPGLWVENRPTEILIAHPIAGHGTALP
jgi:membrane protein DedA with SNARE-associated domain